MRQIIYALTGNDDCPPITDMMLTRFIDRLRDDLEDVIWTASMKQNALAKRLFNSFSKMSDEQKALLFLSTEAFEAIFESHRRRSDEWYEAIIAAIDNVINPTTKPSVDNPFAASDTPLEFVLGQTITVDVGTPRCQRNDPGSPVFLLDFERLTHDETQIVATKLKRAFQEIETYTPSFARLIRNYTRRIYVRKVLQEYPASEQVDTELGAIRLRNLHLDEYDHDQLVDDLIHESTHNFLGTFEYLYFPFVPYGTAPKETVRPVSPWSMRPIKALPFVHAAFVYFAMYQYAVKRLNMGVDDPKTKTSLIERRNRYSSGFLMPGFLHEYISSLTLCDPRAVTALYWMEEIILNQAESDIADTLKQTSNSQKAA